MSSSVEKYFAQKEPDYQVLVVDSVRQAIETMTKIMPSVS